MNKIYIEISKLTPKFKRLCHKYIHDEQIINDAVQELMVYLLQMNKEALRNIYNKDGIEGISKYGYVALRRSLLSPRSKFYYKYRKYYEPFENWASMDNYDLTESGEVFMAKQLYNLPNEEPKVYQWEKLEKIDVALEDFTWYDRKIFELYYYEGNTLDSLAKKTGISRNSLFSTIDKVRKILKEKLNE